MQVSDSNNQFPLDWTDHIGIISLLRAAKRAKTLVWKTGVVFGRIPVGG